MDEKVVHGADEGLVGVDVPVKGTRVALMVVGTRRVNRGRSHDG